MNQLTRELLDFELQLPGRRPTRPEVRARFGWSLATYYSILWAIIDLPMVVEAEPMLVGRLHRIRDHSRTARRSLVA